VTGQRFAPKFLQVSNPAASHLKGEGMFLTKEERLRFAEWCEMNANDSELIIKLRGKPRRLGRGGIAQRRKPLLFPLFLSRYRFF
jgi:hypothetical protein